MKAAFGLHVMPSHLKSAGGIIVPINSLQLIPNETYTLDGHDTHERESREAQGGEYKYRESSHYTSSHSTVSQ